MGGVQVELCKQRLSASYWSLRESAAGQISFGGRDQDQAILRSKGSCGIFAAGRLTVWQPLQLLAATAAAAQRMLADLCRSCFRADPAAGVLHRYSMAW